MRFDLDSKQNHESEKDREMTEEEINEVMNEDEILHKLMVAQETETLEGLSAMKSLYKKRLELSKRCVSRGHETLARCIVYSTGIDLKGETGHATV